jgi:hypothetical protein
MSRLEMILLAVSLLSVSFNVFMIMYSRRLLTEFLSISEELGDIQQMTTNFANHVEAVYGLESFYGDETLRSLLEHARSFDEYLGTFERIYTLTTDIEKETDDNDENPEEAEA